MDEKMAKNRCMEDIQLEVDIFRFFFGYSVHTTMKTRHNNENMHAFFLNEFSSNKKQVLN